MQDIYKLFNEYPSWQIDTDEYVCLTSDNSIALIRCIFSTFLLFT